MTRPRADILMITHERAEYTQRSLPRLLESVGVDDRVWIWHNGLDTETLGLVRAHVDHPRLHRIHESPHNVGIRLPTNWFWEESDAPLVGKVDDDCLVPDGWVDQLSAAHDANPSFGSIACWHFREEDFDESLAADKLRTFDGGHSLLLNFWTTGSGYLMKRTCVDRLGPIHDGQTFSGYCIKGALAGWVNGWHYPLILQDHMDDPRSEFTRLRSDADMQRFAPLSARTNNSRDLASWDAQLRRSAQFVQTASIDERDYRGVGRVIRRARRRIRRLVTGHYW